jgi:hypothetical protein
MTRCKPFRVSEDGEGRSLWQCSACGRKSSITTHSPPAWDCANPSGEFGARHGVVVTARPAKQSPCVNLGARVYRLHTKTTGCAGPIQLYRCDHFAEEVTRGPIAAEHVFILQDDGTATPKIRQRRRERGEPEIQEPGPYYRPDYHGRNCVSCPVRDRAAGILHLTFRKGWQDIARRSQFAFRADGLHEVSEDLPSPKSDDLRRRIQAGVKLVINHGFVFAADQFVRIAREFPRIAFVAVNHCALNHTLNSPQVWPGICAYRAAMPTLPNLWLGEPDWLSCLADLFPASIRGRVVWWPNPVALPPSPATVRPDPPCILLACRSDVVKALPSQLCGMALAQRQRPSLRCVLSLANGSAPKLIEATGGRIETAKYADAAGWARRLREEVSVAMQASMAESFNYVALDALGWGRPVVGSSAIRYLPPAWTCNPNDPRQIAAMILEHLDDYEARAAEARRVAEAVSGRQNAAYCQTIKGLLSE